MSTTLFLLIIGLLALVVGAEFLVRGGATLALRLRIRPLVIGLTVVAFGTSAPEMAVSIKSALLGQGDVAAGNVIGSNIFNIAAILGLSALVYPLAVHAKLIRVDIPIMISVSIAAVFLFNDDFISRTEGLFLFLGLLVYTFLTFRLSARTEPEVEQEAAAELPVVKGGLWLDVVMIVGGLVGLILGADWFVRGAIEVARWAGLSEAVIGLTIVAAGTSLPELATSVVASVRRHTDIAIGNIVGSNLFNILAILGVTGLVHPFACGNIQRVDFVVMLLFSILLLPLAATDFRLKRWEGGLLLVGYIAYIMYRLGA